MINPRRLLICILLSACSSERGRTEDPASAIDAGSATQCETAADCHDDHDCTVDSCGANGLCQHEPVDALCEAGQVCVVGEGCLAEEWCNDNADCDDAVACTLDSCIVGNRCEHTALDALCPEPGATCNPVSGCEAGESCTSADECDDGVECTVDICNADRECEHNPQDALCEGEAICTETGCFSRTPCETDAECDDGDFCNGREICEFEFGCRPAAEPRTCADTDDCTLDSCSDSLNMCMFVCDHTREECGCPLETPCDGTFVVTPAPEQSCACVLGPCHVSYNVTTVTFDCVGDVLSVNAGVPTIAMNTNMSQNPRIADGSFDVEAVVDGGCEEHYRLTGSFTGPDTFEAVWTATYIERDGSCSLSGCSAQSIAVSGTRM